MDRSPAAVIDCRTGKRQPLLQANALADHFAQRGNSTLFAAHNGQVVEYHWSQQRMGWAPSWVVADYSGHEIHAMDVVGSRLLLFSQGTVQVLDLAFGARCGVWTLPSDVLGAGCAIEGGSSVMLFGKMSRDTPSAENVPKLGRG